MKLTLKEVETLKLIFNASKSGLPVPDSTSVQEDADALVLRGLVEKFPNGIYVVSNEGKIKLVLDYGITLPSSP